MLEPHGVSPKFWNAGAQATPPLARSTWPLTQSASGLARKDTTEAMSSGCTRRCSGGVLAKACTCSSSLEHGAHFVGAGHVGLHGEAVAPAARAGIHAAAAGHLRGRANLR